MAARRRFEWMVMSVDQWSRDVIVLQDDKPPRGKDGRITGWLPYTPERRDAVRSLASWLNKHCPPHMTADDFWQALHSDEGS